MHSVVLRFFAPLSSAFMRGAAMAALTVASGMAFTVEMAVAAEEVLSLQQVVDTKAVYGRIETRDVVPARARIGGTLVELKVEEGSQVTAGQVIALVADPKLALQVQAMDGKLKALEAELNNAKTEMERANALVVRGVTTKQRVDQLRTQVEVYTSQITAAQAERAVITQQSTEGQVLAPVSGRVLKVPVTRGGVLMPGEAVATLAGGGFYLRLALPERHAALLKLGADVSIGEEGHKTVGKLAKIYPQIENGRVIADVSVENLGTYFVGERTLVHVPIATRKAMSVPPEAIITRAGIDYVRLQGDAGVHEVAVVLGLMVETPEGLRLEVLSGLTEGDRLLIP